MVSCAPRMSRRPSSGRSWARSLERDLRHGDLRKVVLARQCLVHGDCPFDPARALARLRDGYADCFIFAVAHGSRCFLGASPERLVRLSRGTVRATCLAGSIARGSTPEQDRRLGEELLASAKDRAEHAFVAVISDALADAGVACAPLGAQTLMKLRNVQHLFTPVVGQAPGDLNILELVERLHPTPAVGGYPRAAALPAIAQRERLDCGWYAGPIGWMDARGDGEFAVAIRSALLRGAEGGAVRGCGLVAGSDPEREYVELSLKLCPMLSVLGGSMSSAFSTPPLPRSAHLWTSWCSGAQLLRLPRLALDAARAHDRPPPGRAPVDARCNERSAGFFRPGDGQNPARVGSRWSAPRARRPPSSLPPVVEAFYARVPRSCSRPTARTSCATWARPRRFQ